MLKYVYKTLKVIFALHWMANYEVVKLNAIMQCLHVIDNLQFLVKASV